MGKDGIPRLMIALACLAMAAGTATAASAGEVAGAPDRVRPLLIGASVPDLVLESSQGKAFDLSRAIAGKPTILIFYRGGW